MTEFISPGFFDVFGIGLLRGRDFSWDDDVTAPPVGIVTASAAHELFSDVDPVGHRVSVLTGPTSADVVIVGVAADATIGSIREPHVVVVFRPLMQGLSRAQSPMTSVLVSGDLKSVRDAYMRIVERRGQHYVRGLFTLEEWIDFSLLPERLLTSVSITSGLLTIVLACIGLYGLLAYMVGCRVREIGIRMALGATHRSVLLMIMSQGVGIVGLGVLFGIGCALATTRVMQSQLYGVAASDPSTLIVTALLFLSTGSLATLVPARRAAGIDPVRALRQQ